MRKKTQLLRVFPGLKNDNVQTSRHSREVDLMGLNLALEMPGVRLYCVSEAGCLKDYLPLADVQNQRPMSVENKPEDAIKDFLPLHYTGGKMMKFFRTLGVRDEEYLALKGTIPGLLVQDLWIVIRVGMKILIGLLRSLFHRGK